MARTTRLMKRSRRRRTVWMSRAAVGPGPKAGATSAGPARAGGGGGRGGGGVGAAGRRLGRGLGRRAGAGQVARQPVAVLRRRTGARGGAGGQRLLAGGEQFGVALVWLACGHGRTPLPPKQFPRS